MLACLVPVAVLIRVAFADWISAVVIGVTLPLIPVFAILVGLHTKATTQRQWRLLSRLGGHFLDVVEGLPTLKLFGRGKPQAEVIGEVTEEYRAVTMSTLRVAFLSAFVLELAAALATALVAVEVGLRLLAGHMSYSTALLVLLLTPEAYLPLRAVGAQFHASTEGAAAAHDVFEILDTAVPASADPNTPTTAPQVPAPHRPAPGRRVSLRDDTIKLTGVCLAYPGRDRPALAGVNLTIRPGDQITLTGPSGAGKSSLLALLLRFAEPTGGRIEVGGLDLSPSRWRSGAARSAGSRSSPTCSPRRWPPTSRSASRRRAPEAIAAGRAGGRSGRVHRGPARWLRHRRSASAACGCPRASASRSRWPARSCATLRCSCSTSPPRTWTRSAPAGSSEAIATLMAGRTVIQVTHSQTQTRDIGRVFTLDHGTLAPGHIPVPGLGPPPAPVVSGRRAAGGHVMTAVSRPARARGPHPGARPASPGPRRCCGCCCWPGRCAASCCSPCWPARSAAAAGWRCWPPPASCSPAPRSTPTSWRSRSRWSWSARSASAAGCCATSSACSRTTWPSACSPTSGWRSTGGWSGWPRPGWPPSGPATCSPG